MNVLMGLLAGTYTMSTSRGPDVLSGVKFEDLSYPLGAPEHMRAGDAVEFALGSGQDLSRGCSFRKVPIQSQWLLANARYRAGGRVMVTDFRGKGQYRVWTVEPTEDVVGRGVVLRPVSEGETLFRGDKAYPVDPLVLVPGLQAVVEFMAANESFDRTTVTSGSKRAFSDVSKWMALIHGLGFISATDRRASYSEASPEVAAVKSPKDRAAASGERVVYSKTTTWDAFFKQWETFSDSGAKSEEARPSEA